MEYIIVLKKDDKNHAVILYRHCYRLPLPCLTWDSTKKQVSIYSLDITCMRKYLINIQLIAFLAQASSTALKLLYRHNNTCMEYMHTNFQEISCTLANALFACRDFMYQCTNVFARQLTWKFSCSRCRYCYACSSMFGTVELALLEQGILWYLCMQLGAANRHSVDSGNLLTMSIEHYSMLLSSFFNIIPFHVHSRPPCTVFCYHRDFST